MIVNGDLTQVDLPKGKKSGLQVATDILKPVRDIGFVYLQGADVVRHTLVKRVLEAYDQEGNE